MRVIVHIVNAFVGRFGGELNTVGVGTVEVTVLGVGAADRAFLVAAVFAVRFDVFVEVVAAHEALITHGAGEPLLARVCPYVAL